MPRKKKFDIICPEKEFGKGCDIAAVNRKIAYLVEFKKCNFSIDDARKAVRQIQFTEEKLIVNNKITHNDTLVRIILHDDHGGCHVYSQAQIELERRKIKRQPLSSAPKFLRRLYNLYKKSCRN